MTPLELQEELVTEMSRILDGYRYKTPAGEPVPINVYKQYVPMSQVDDENERFPYIIVRLNSGEDDGTRDSFNTVSLLVIIGIWDDDLEAQGHRDVMNIIQKIYQRFHENPDLNRNAAYAGKFRWSMQEEDLYPYYIGACSMDFHIPAIRREDYFA